jgi:hypothetical protein
VNDEWRNRDPCYDELGLAVSTQSLTVMTDAMPFLFPSCFSGFYFFLAFKIALQGAIGGPRWVSVYLRDLTMKGYPLAGDQLDSLDHRTMIEAGSSGVRRLLP